MISRLADARENLLLLLFYLYELSLSGEPVTLTTLYQKQFLSNQPLESKSTVSKRLKFLETVGLVHHRYQNINGKVHNVYSARIELKLHYRDVKRLVWLFAHTARRLIRDGKG